MINMASFEQGFMFGEFDDLSPEEHDRILNILHGQRRDSGNKVEFPWKNEEEELTGAVGGAVCSNKNWSEETIEFGTQDNVYRAPVNEGYQISFLSNESHVDQPESYNNSAYPNEAMYQMPPPGVGQYPMQAQYMPPSGSSQYMQQNVQSQNQYESSYSGDPNDASVDRSGSKLQASLKQYERRNKKKRPPDYYKQTDDTSAQHSVNMNNEQVPYDLSQPPPTYHTQMQYGAPPPGINANNFGINQPRFIHNAVQNPPIQPLDIQRIQQETYQGANSQSGVTGMYTDNMIQRNGGSNENRSSADQVDLREVIIHSVSPMQQSTNIPATPETYQNQDHERTSANYHLDSNAVQKESVNAYQEYNPNMNMPPNTIVYHSNVEAATRNAGMETSGPCGTGSNESSLSQSNVVVENSTTQSVENSDPNTNNRNKNSDIAVTTDPISVECDHTKTNCAESPIDPVPEIVNSQGQMEKVQSEPTAPKPASVPSDPVKRPVTWAGLFKSNTATNTQSVVHETPAPSLPGDNNTSVASNNDTKSDKEPSPAPVLASEDSAAKDLGEHLARMSISHASVALQPRGLVNRANWCYINGTLQALVACPPFYYLLKRLPRYPGRGPSSTPILDAMVEFVNEFQPMSRSHDKGHKGTREISPGIPFEPSYVYKMLQAIAVNPHFKLGKQEDAEEFLSCILDGMHEEMSAAVNLNTDQNTENQVTDSSETEDGFINGYVHAEGEEVDAEPEEDSWEQVGPKKKSVLTRRANFAKTPIADIFAGMLRSAVYKTSAKETATLEPFFTLQLDIQSDKVWNVKDALEGFVSKEQIMGYTCSNTKTEVEVSKKLSLEELPPVLILHLKFFVYNKDGGCQKVIKKLDYGVELEITKDLLSPSARNKLSIQQRSYKLFAVVYHHGKKATGGHYTTSVFHPGINGWVHSDDSQVKTVPAVSVLKYVPPRVPYLLYYRRLDSH